uniref:Uncharacterized protein n=1 Tax=Rhizophora mucronata TaxID=61149 RepID=A0A2P2Q4B7_RHIMU
MECHDFRIWDAWPHKWCNIIFQSYCRIGNKTK